MIPALRTRNWILRALLWTALSATGDGFMTLQTSCLRWPPSSFSRPTQNRLIIAKTGGNDDGDAEEEEIVYNDFDFVIGDSSISNSNNPAQDTLQQRIREQQQQDLKKETRLLQNWKNGDWSVRGFSLDPSDAFSEALAENDRFDDSRRNVDRVATPIHVCKIVADANSEGSRVWVGRSDGSVVWVQLGSEYATHFRSKITGQFFEGEAPANADSNAQPSTSAQFKSELVRDAYNDQFANSMNAPFQILAQLSPPLGGRQSQVSAILSIPDEDSIFTAYEGYGQVHQWHISEDDIGSENPAHQASLPLAEGIHADTIVALKNVIYQDRSLLLSVSAEGTMALWDIRKGDLICQCPISIEEMIEPGEQTASFANMLQCADVDESHIFLGTSSGFVLAYDVSDLIVSAGSAGKSCPVPRGKFKAHDGAVTALASGGCGSLGRVGGSAAAEETSSTLLITGGSNGVVKQWEMLSRASMQKIEHWPKLPSQRLPKKAHLFEGHDGPVTAVEAMGGRRPQFLSASEDGTIRIWNAAEGKECYRMDGFTKDLSSLCVLGGSESNDDVLVTGGMNQYVCVHDFSQGWNEDSIGDFMEPFHE